MGLPHGGEAAAPAGSAAPVVSAVIPCLDEEVAIAAVVKAVLSHGIAEVVVVDGGSRDQTARRAAEAGALVVMEPRPGYGRAIQSGIAAVRSDAEIILFLDGDGSDPAERAPALIAPIAARDAVFVLGSRVRGAREAGSLSLQQVAAARIGSLLLRLAYGARFSDLSPFRAIRRDALERLGMRDLSYGWNLEMLMRVAAARLPAVEVSVGQRRRTGGQSKVSGNPVAAIKAACVITATFLRVAFQLRRASGT